MLPLLVAVSFSQIWVTRVDAEFTDFDRSADRLAFGTFASFGHLSLETGKKAWAASLKEGQLGTRIAADTKTTVVCIGQGPVSAYESSSGKLRWSVAHQGYASPVAVSGSTVLAELSPNHLSALDAGSGKELWKQTIEPDLNSPEAQLSTKPLSLGSDLLVSGRQGILLSLDPTTGAIRWKTSLGDSPAQALLADSEDVYAATARGVIYAVSRRTGTIYWHYDASNAIAGSPILQNGRLLFVSSGGYEVCLAALNGAYLWRTEFSRDQDFSVTGPIANGTGTLFVRRSGAVALDEAGRINWQTSLPSPASLRAPERYKADYILFESHAVFRMRPQ